MAESRFSRLLEQIRGADFSNERKEILETAAHNNYFTCEQLGRILDVLEFSEERITAIKLIADRLVDPENSHEVLSHLEFEGEKSQARKILVH